MAWLGMASRRDRLPVDKWEIPASSIILEERLGEGCFGEVHRGVVKGPLPSTHMMKSAICKTVAIKFLKRKYIVANIDMNGRICGALVQFGCYQHKHK